MTTEKQLVESIRLAIDREYPDAWVFKVHGGPYQRVGVPDLLVCVQGLLVGLEVKHQKPGESETHARGRVTASQQDQIDKIVRAGGYAREVLTVEEAMEALRTVLQ